MVLNRAFLLECVFKCILIATGIRELQRTIYMYAAPWIFTYSWLHQGITVCYCTWHDNFNDVTMERHRHQSRGCIPPLRLVSHLPGRVHGCRVDSRICLQINVCILLLTSSIRCLPTIILLKANSEWCFFTSIIHNHTQKPFNVMQAWISYQVTALYIQHTVYSSIFKAKYKQRENNDVTKEYALKP